MSAALNPFRSTGPIRDAEAFVDRERELRVVLEALEKGQSVQIFGPRRRGKTSLLFAVQRALKEKGQQGLYLTLELFPTASAFWRALAKEAGIAEAGNTEAPDYLALGEALAETKIVLLLDELDRAIADPAGYPDDFFVALRGLEIGHGIPFVVTAKERLGQYARFHGGPTSPFGNTFLPLALPPFDEEAARMLLAPLTERAQAAGWPEDWIQQVHQDAQGEPWKLQRFGEQMWEAEPMPPWKVALNAWREALQEGGGAVYAETYSSAEDVGGSPLEERTSPAPWYLTPAFLGLLLMAASGLGIAGLALGSLVVGIIAFLLFVLLFVLVLRYLGQ